MREHRVALYKKTLHVQKLEAKTYARIYSSDARWFGRRFLALQFSAAFFGFMITFLPSFILNSLASDIVSRTLAGISSILILISTKWDPSKKEGSNEISGDKYRNLYEYIRINEDDCDTTKEYKKLKQKVFKKGAKLRFENDEPDPSRFDRIYKMIDDNLKRLNDRYKAYDTQSEAEDDDDEMVQIELGLGSSLSVEIE